MDSCSSTGRTEPNQDADDLFDRLAVPTSPGWPGMAASPTVRRRPLCRSGGQRCYDHPNGVSHEHGAAAPDRGRWRSGRVPSRQSLRTRGRRCRRDGRLRASVRSRGPAGRNLGGQLPPGRSGPPSRWEPQVALREVVAHRMRGRWARPSPGCGPTTVVGQAFPFDVATFVSARWASGTAPVQTSTNASDWTNLVTLHGRGCQSVGGRLAEQTERADRTGGSPSPAIPSITLPVISP